MDTITYDQAVSLLPDGDYVHTFRNSGFALFGADWTREAVVQAITDSDVIALTGGTARSLGHGIAINDDGRPLFIETVREKLDALDPVEATTT